jgi:maleylacetoacetate isomerase
MKLHTYWRSSAAYRLRVALNLKGLSAEHVPVHLAKGKQTQDVYRALNPQGLVPCLELDDGTALAQSLAILEYLEEVYPTPPLLPRDPAERARVRGLALAIACEIHPLNNLRVLKYVTGPLGQDEATRNAWYTHWVRTGFDGLEESLNRQPPKGVFLTGAEPGLFEVVLVPQVYNARRFSVDLTAYPRLLALDAACQALPAFAAAAPENQADAE